MTSTTRPPRGAGGWNRRRGELAGRCRGGGGRFAISTSGIVAALLLASAALAHAHAAAAAARDSGGLTLTRGGTGVGSKTLPQPPFPSRSSRAETRSGHQTAREGDGEGEDASRSSEPPSPRLLTTDDIRREMQKARGRVLIIHLWATWCGPCLEELPRIDRFARDARARGAVVLAISVDSDYRGIGRVPSVLRSRAPSLSAAVAHFSDPDAFRTLFWKSWEGSIPASFIFDRAGRLHKALLNGADAEELTALLDEVLPAKPPATAGPRSAAPR